ncbi:MAG: AAA family ATPase [Metamycoplasmataceae bacterium]
MYIEYIKIKNFRGLNLELNNLKDNFLIIGKNGSGKSNLCHALNKVLNYSARRIPLESSDSTNHNEKEITIEIHLNLIGLSVEQRGEIGYLIDQVPNEGEKLIVKYIGKYQKDISSYDEDIEFGKYDKTILAASKSNPLDRILLFTYINANYNLEESKRSFFRFKKNKEKISVDISSELEQLNKKINDDKDVSEITRSLNNNSSLNEIFKDINFKVASNIEVSNLYKSLDIVPQSSRENTNYDDIRNIGDGKNKVLSLST